MSQGRLDVGLVFKIAVKAVPKGIALLVTGRRYRGIGGSVVRTGGFLAPPKNKRDGEKKKYAAYKKETLLKDSSF
jgi:hypothetical protein